MKRKLLQSYRDVSGIWVIDPMWGKVFVYLKEICFKRKGKKKKLKTTFIPPKGKETFLPPKHHSTEIEKRACNNLVKISRTSIYMSLN